MYNLKKNYEENYIMFIIGADLFGKAFQESECPTDLWATFCALLARHFLIGQWNSWDDFSLYENVCHFVNAHVEIIEDALKSEENLWKWVSDFQRIYPNVVQY